LERKRKKRAKREGKKEYGGGGIDDALRCSIKTNQALALLRSAGKGFVLF